MTAPAESLREEQRQQPPGQGQPAVDNQRQWSPQVTGNEYLNISVEIIRISWLKSDNWC